MKAWFERVIVWTIVGFAAFAVTLAVTSSADSARYEVPLWVPVAGMALLVAGGAVLRRGLLDQND